MCVYEYKCAYKAEYCILSLDVNECDQQPSICLNGGTCFNIPGDYNCSCSIEWAGKNCQSSKFFIS